MKKLLVIIMALLLIGFAAQARAENLSVGDFVKKLPALKQGIAFSLVENDFNYLSTFEVLKWKGVSLEAGYSSENKAVAVLSYELLKLKDLGVKVPVLDLVSFQPGIWFGVGRLQKDIFYRTETDYGISCTLIALKF